MPKVMCLVSKLGFFFVIISFCYYLLSIWCVRDFFRKIKNSKKLLSPPKNPVSVIKPLKRTFPGLKGNLETFCNQTYQEYEIIIGTTHPADPELLMIVKDLPHCSVKVARTERNPGPNYKVGNLLAAASLAKYKILVISDADMRVSPRYLENVVHSFQQKNVGLVTCLYKVVSCRSIAAAIEALSVQFDFLPNVIIANTFGSLDFAFGATIAVSSDILKEIGGLETLFPYLADDYQLGYKVSRAGYEVKLAPEIVDHVVGKKSWKEFFKQQLRWSVTYRVCRPVGYFFSFITHTVSLATINLLLNQYTTWSLTAWIIILTTRYLGCIYTNSKYIQNSGLKSYLWLIPLRDLFSTFIWAASFLTNKVFWAGKYFTVKKDGSMEVG